MKRCFFTLFILVALAGCTKADSVAVDTYTPTPLRFNADGTFKIALICDVHLHLPNVLKSEQAENLITTTLRQEKPDLAFFLGDAVWSPATLTGFTELAMLCVNERIPYSFVLGNHDRDGGLYGETIFHLLSQLPYFVGRDGLASLSGNGNYDLPILNAVSNKVEAVLYGLDSHDTGPYILDDYYDCIKTDQIDWYRQVSRNYTEANQGTPLPSLMFFHIPLIEYNDAYAQGLLTGQKNENVHGPKVNSGMFDAVVAQKDVMGIFVGHDHDNNFLATLNNVILGYGNLTGYGSYGSMQRGVRMVTLQQGVHAFQTYIRLDDGNIIDRWPNN